MFLVFCCCFAVVFVVFAVVVFLCVVMLLLFLSEHPQKGINPYLQCVFPRLFLSLFRSFYLCLSPSFSSFFAFLLSFVFFLFPSFALKSKKQKKEERNKNKEIKQEGEKKTNKIIILYKARQKEEHI